LKMGRSILKMGRSILKMGRSILKMGRWILRWQNKYGPVGSRTVNNSGPTLGQ